MVVGQFTQETDLVVIGAGPAGYTAAFRAAELGVQTTIVDARRGGELGGVCLHEGCIPSKTLLGIIETMHAAERARDLGVTFAAPKVDVKAVRAWVNATVKRLSSGLDALAKKHGVDRVDGRAHFEDSRNLGLVDGSVPRIRFKKALLATGSTSRVHPELPFDGIRILTAREALAFEVVPKTLLIVGSDYVAAELTMIFSALGSAVTVALDGDRWLPTIDPDVVRPLHKRLGELASVYVNARPRLAGTGKKGAMIEFPAQGGSERPRAFDCVVVCAGHIGNTRGLQLEKTHAKVDAAEFVHIDSRTLRTDDTRIFAAGDVAGGELLAGKAIAQGRVAAEIMAGRDSIYDARAVPMTIFTDPQVACVGLSEQEAKQQEIPAAVLKMPWGASGRAVGMGRGGDGLTKIIHDPASQIVFGVGIVGPHACEMIGEAALAIEMGATLTDVALTMHPHPTMSELIAGAAKAARDS